MQSIQAAAPLFPAFPPASGVSCPSGGPALPVPVVPPSLRLTSGCFLYTGFPPSHPEPSSCRDSILCLVFLLVSFVAWKSSSLLLPLSLCPPQLYSLGFAFTRATTKFCVVKFSSFKTGPGVRSMGV